MTATDYLGRVLRADERMSDIEALFWALESHDRRFVSAMNLLAVLDRRLDREAVERRIELVTRRVPRLRDRAVPGPLRMVPPRWQPDPQFDLARHVRWVSLGGGAVDDLMLTAAPLLGKAFDRSRPPWEMVFVDDVQGGRSAVLARLHHSYTDGLGALKLAAELFDFEATAAGPLPLEPEVRRADRQTVLGRLRDDIGFELRRGRKTVGDVLPWAAGGLRDAVVGPAERAQVTHDLLASLGQASRAALRPGSDVMVSRSATTGLGIVELDLAEMKRRARATDATVNDVFLAGLLGGMRLYHVKHGSRTRSLRIAVPVSTRGSEGGDDDMRNQVDGFLVRAPIGLADPAERVRLIHEMVIEGRGAPFLGVLPVAASAVLHLPGVTQLLARAAGSVDVIASNLPGSPVPVYLTGARVERLVPFGPRGGAALNLTLLSYSDSVSVGVNADPVAVPDHDVLMDCLRAGFDETLA